MSHTSNMARHARQGAKQLRSAARHLRETADEERDGIMHTVQKMGNEAVGAVKDGYQDLRETASDYVSQGRAKAESLEHSVEKQIKQHPLTSVMVFLGVGFLAGLLYSRR